jgi:hypothetical protein
MAHFYDRITAEPRHFVKMKSGKMRPSTVRDAKKNGWNPSVSTVLSNISDDGILRWQKEEIIDACWLSPYNCGADIKKWKTKIRQLSDRKREIAASDGQRIHKALEMYYKGEQCELAQLDTDIVTEVDKFLWREFGDVYWEAEKTFTLDFGGGYGGCVDLHTKDGKGIILDFKSQQTGDHNNFKYYKKYLQQLAAYAYGLGKEKGDCYILKVSSTHPGVIGLKKYSKNEIDRAFNEFYHLLRYYYISNKFNEEI